MKKPIKQKPPKHPSDIFFNTKYLYYDTTKKQLVLLSEQDADDIKDEDDAEIIGIDEYELGFIIEILERCHFKVNYDDYYSTYRIES